MFDQLVTDIKALPVPPGDEAALAELFAAQDKVQAKNREFEDAAADEDFDRIDALDREITTLITAADAKWDAYGLGSCGSNWGRSRIGGSVVDSERHRDTFRRRPPTWTSSPPSCSASPPPPAPTPCGGQLTSPALTSRYLHGLSLESDWQPGATVTARGRDGRLVGEVLAVAEPRRLSFTLAADDDQPETFVTWEIHDAETGSIVRLYVDEPDGDGETEADVAAGDLRPAGRPRRRGADDLPDSH